MIPINLLQKFSFPFKKHLDSLATRGFIFLRKKKGDNHMIGTIVNTATILLGSFIGSIAKKGIKEE